MRVRKLSTFIGEQNLVGSVNMEALRGIRIGIDTVHWLRTIMLLKDPFADALGGCPPNLFPVIAIELDHLAKYDIHPVFIFEGMSPPLCHELWDRGAGQQQQLDAAWSSVADKNEQVSNPLPLSNLLGGPA